MPEIKRIPQDGRMNLDFHERILPPGAYREGLNINIGRSETSEVGTVENLLGNVRVGDTNIGDNVTCIGSYRDNGAERIYYFVTNNDSFDERRGTFGEFSHGVFEFDQLSGTLRPLTTSDNLNFHKNFLITGINLVDGLLFWTDDRNEPRKINVERARNNPLYYDSDLLMSVARPAPSRVLDITAAGRDIDGEVTSTFLEDKLPRFSYRWRFEDGEYSVLAPFSPILFQPPSGFSIDLTNAIETGEVSSFLNTINSVNLTVPIQTGAGITSVELIYKDTSSTTVYIVEDKPVTTESSISFEYRSQDPFRALPGSQVTRVYDAVPRRAKSQEVAGGRIVYGNYLQNYNLPDISFSVTAENYDSPIRGTENHSLKTRRTYQVGIVLYDAAGRTSPVILSRSGRDTVFVEYPSDVALSVIQPQALQIGFEPDSITSLIDSGDWAGYRVVVKQREQEYYNWFTDVTGQRSSDSANKVPIDQTEIVEPNAINRPSSRSVYQGNTLLPVTIFTQNLPNEVPPIVAGDALVNGGRPNLNLYEVEPVTSELDIFFETPTGGVVDNTMPTENSRQAVHFFNCIITPFESVSIEANRIRMGFNEPFFDIGVRAHIVQENYAGEERRANTLIHSSGFFNSRTGLNQLNQFNEAEGGITVSLDPADGSIQKLFAEDTQLIIWQEDKVSRSPVDKDFIYSAEGGAVPVTSNTQYLGTIAPYAGEYGISKDPASFSVYGTRKYFTDRNRGVVLRLSQDGLTEISQTGMSDFFRDALRRSTSIIGSFSEYHNTYNLTIIGEGYSSQMDTNRATSDDGYFTIGFEEDVNGWPTFKSFQQESGTTLNNRYYTFNGGDLWEHNREDVLRNDFYGNGPAPSYIDFIVNDGPSQVKNFLTAGYEGAAGWSLGYLRTDIDSVGDVPSVSGTFYNVTLDVSIAQDMVANSVFTGESTNIVAEGEQTEWIVIVSPISNQFELDALADVILEVDGVEIGGANKSLDNGNIYFRVTHTATADATLTGVLSGEGAELVGDIAVLSMNFDINLTDASLFGSLSRVFGEDEAGLVTDSREVIANNLYYIASVDDITVDSTQLEMLGVLQPQGVSKTLVGTDDLQIDIPLDIPTVPVGSATVGISGSATLKPLLTWQQDITGLTGFDNFNIIRPDGVQVSFGTPIPRSPRESDITRTVNYSFNIENITTDVFDMAPELLPAAGETITDPMISNETGQIQWTIESDITTSNTANTLTPTGSTKTVTLEAVLPTQVVFGPDAESHEFDFNSNTEFLVHQNANSEFTVAFDPTGTVEVTASDYDDITLNPRTDMITVMPQFSRLTGITPIEFSVIQEPRFTFSQTGNDVVAGLGGNKQFIGALVYPDTYDIVRGADINEAQYEQSIAIDNSDDNGVRTGQITVNFTDDVPAGTYILTIEVGPANDPTPVQTQITVLSA